MMEFIRNLNHLRVEHRHCVATIGNFDGMHLGHQKILQELSVKAKALKLPAVVIIFEPQAKEFFPHAETPARLSRLREKLSLFKKLPIDTVLCLPFNHALSNLSADQFIQKVLIEGLAIKHLIVGDDFRFGKGRQGTFQHLQSAGQQHDFTVVDTPSIQALPLNGDNQQKQRISSSWVRTALAAGDIATAHYLLGRAYFMMGRVAHGQKKGRTIGFPTANIRLHRDVSPLFGVFAVQLRGIQEKPLAGVANLGLRPTVDGKFPLLEVHLFDFSADIYGHLVQVDFLQFIRAEKRFDSFQQLKQQISHDCDKAREYFRNKT